MEELLASYIDVDALSLGWRIGIICGIIVVSYLVDLFFDKVIVPTILKITAKTEAKWDDIVFDHKVLDRFSNILPPVILLTALPFFMADEWEEMIRRFFHAYIIFSCCRFVCAIIDAFFNLSADKRGDKVRSLRGVTQTLQVLAWFVSAILMISAAFGKSPFYFITGLGAAATVLMLVFQDSIKGLVAGIQLSAQDMLRTGDWICMPSRNVDGVVLDITLNTVKVQNWDNTILTVQPYALITETFQNWRGMQDSDGRRISRGINIDVHSIKMTADGSTNLTKYREELTSWLKQHPKVNQEMMPLMVRQLPATDIGIPVQIYCFTKIQEWMEYEEIQAQMVEYMIALLPKYGLAAFQRSGGLHAETSK